MKNIQALGKTALLIGAVALFAFSALPSVVDAGEGVFCEATGHTCHVDIGGTTYHLEEV